MQGKQTQILALDMYMRRMYRVIMILAPFFCLVAGILFSSYKALGFYPDVPMVPLVIFDASCVLYCIIGAVLCRGCIDANNQLKPSYFRMGKLFISISLVIQWNFISYLFPVSEFWAFVPFFLIAGVVFLDAKFVTSYALALLASTYISWALRPEVFLPASQLYFVPDLFLRIVCISFATLAMCIVTYLVRRICVTDVTNELVDEAERESLIDAMTQRNNRKAYYLASESIEKPERLGVVFADVNGLKYTNDNFGHAAGDRLIIDFAQMLAEFFREREIFRISGDEFVVLCQDIDEDLFDRRVDRFRAQLAGQDNPIATFGVAYGHTSQGEAIAVAEKRMYEHKVAYYERFPERKR